jgi:predicted metal-dependent HD superfamily phosphohydrolase
MKFYTENFKFPIEIDHQFMLFALFHDIVYDPQAEKGKNERDSAEIFKEFALENELSSSSEFVSQCILDTISHQPHDPENEYVKAFLDCDLSILGSPYDLYSQYAKDI